MVLAAWLAAVLVASTALPGLAERYYLLLPGEVYPVAAAIELPPERRQEAGDLHYSIVYQAEADLLGALRRSIERGVRVVPYEAVIPRGTSPAESTRLNRRLMSESQTAAAIVALRAAGFHVGDGGDGVRITGTVERRPAHGVLLTDDVVLALDGASVRTANELIEAIRRRSPGDSVSLRVRRGSAELELAVGTVASPTEPARPVVGATIETENYRAKLPFPVTITSGEVIGPSAGLMFALGIYDMVTPGRLGGERRVAGTGTVGSDGRVGPVDGAAQKVIAAERAGASLFLVPVENAPDARRTARTIRVVPVATFDEALAALR